MVNMATDKGDVYEEKRSLATMAFKGIAIFVTKHRQGGIAIVFCVFFYLGDI